VVLRGIRIAEAGVRFSPGPQHMTKYILHGGYTKLENDSNRAFFREIVKDLLDTATILLVYFAREDVEIPKLFERDKKSFLGTGKKDLNFLVASSEDFIQQIQNADAVYLSGGETEKLLNTLKQFPAFAKAVTGKVVAGSSAGAYALARYYYSNSRNTVSEGLGILPVKVVCHFKSKIHDVPATDPVELMEKYSENLELVVLADCESRLFIV
jgi:peptidase E